MRPIYVGDACDVVRRILTNHCSGNVEGSAFRKYVAEAMGFKIKKEKRPSGSTRVRIDLPDPKQGEAKVTQYIRSGKWKIVFCDSYNEAHDFQWYVIDRLNPVLNREREVWNRTKKERYEKLFAQLENSEYKSCVEIRKTTPVGPGVYAFFHTQLPSEQ